MKLYEKISDYIRIILNKFKKSDIDNLEIYESISRLDTITKNQIWYRGDEYEIKQMYGQKSDYFGSNSFWIKAIKGKIACRHYPLPQVIVDTLTNLCTNDIQEVKIDNDENMDELLQMILQKSGGDLYEDIIKEQLIGGDCGVYPKFLKNGTIKWEIVSSEECEYLEGNDEWIVKTIYQKDSKNYCLITIFGNGYISYKLVDEKNREVSLGTLNQTKDLQDLTFTKDGQVDEDFKLFTLFKSFKSKKFKNRGKCIYENRDSAFDFVDEVYSTWGNASRKSTAKMGIDANLLGVDSKGNPIIPSDFDVDIIAMGNGDSMSDAGIGLSVYNPTFPSNDYYQTLNMTIQGAMVNILSPTTAGIDMRTYQNNVNTSYSNEIEKISIQTHNKILYAFSESFKELIINTIKCYCYLTHTNYDFDTLQKNIIITFNDFSCPSDDKVVPLFCQAITCGIMSKYEALKEWHVDWSEDMIQDELAKINKDNPTMDDSEFFGLNEEQKEEDKEKGKEVKKVD